MTQHIICFVSGDWSYDGHNMVEKQYYTSNYPFAVVAKALRDGMTALDLPVQDAPSMLYPRLAICEGYEDNWSPPDVAKKLGLDIDDPVKGTIIDGSTYPGDIDQLNNWFNIHLRIIKQANPLIELEPLDIEGSFELGGYGLFFP